MTPRAFFGVETNRGVWACDHIVLASGACARASVPGVAGDVPTSVAQLTPQSYKSRDQIEEGGVLVVGAHAVSRGLTSALKDLEVKTMLVDTDPYNVTRSVALGLPARRMSVLTEEATYDLDLRGIGIELRLVPDLPALDIDADPHRRHLVVGAVVAVNRQPALGPPFPQRRAERLEDKCLAQPAGNQFIDDGRPHHPRRDIGQRGIGGVVIGNILGVAGQTVKAETAGGIDVAEADFSPPFKYSTDSRPPEKRNGLGKKTKHRVFRGSCAIHCPDRSHPCPDAHGSLGSRRSRHR